MLTRNVLISTSLYCRKNVSWKNRCAKIKFKILRRPQNLKQIFNRSWHYLVKSKKWGIFSKFCGLLRIFELYESKKVFFGDNFTPLCNTNTMRSLVFRFCIFMQPWFHEIYSENLQSSVYDSSIYLVKWYFVTKIVLTYCEKKKF